MPRKPRKPCRFSIGDTVEILSTISTCFAGHHGVIVKVVRSPHAHTLDKYTVHLDGLGITEAFWDIQLKADAKADAQTP
jgi:hypothetical protein